MADFLTRLAERTLGMAPVVRPLITSVFAPEPTNQLPGLEHDEEAPASPGDLYRAKSPPAVETPPARGTLKEVSHDLPISEVEEKGTNARNMPLHLSGTSDGSRELYHPAKSGTSERGIATAQEHQSSNTLTAPKPSRRMPDAAGPDSFEGSTVPGGGDQRPFVSAAPAALLKTPESRPGPSHPAKSGSSDHKTMTENDDPRHPSEAAARRPQTPSETRRTEGAPTPTARNAPVGHPEDATMTQEQEKHSNVVPKVMTKKEDQRRPQTPSETRRTEGAPTPTARNAPVGHPEDATMTQEQEKYSNVVPNRQRSYEMIPDEPELLHRAGSGPTQRDVSALSPRPVLSENSPLGPPLADDESGQDVFHPIRTHLDPVQGASLPPRPSPGTKASVEPNEGTTESKVIPDRPAAPDAPPVAPRMVRPQLKPHVERGPQEPRADAPKSSAPTVRVAIGRIEVRAITPPPSPRAQSASPARSAPTLSLDDYLKQRNGEQR